jgi:hypothetical protein
MTLVKLKNSSYSYSIYSLINSTTPKNSQSNFQATVLSYDTSIFSKQQCSTLQQSTPLVDTALHSNSYESLYSFVL